MLNNENNIITMQFMIWVLQNEFIIDTTYVRLVAFHIWI